MDISFANITNEIKKWKFIGKCFSVSNNYSNGAFHFDLSDENGKSIRCVAFTQLAQKFRNKVQQGSIYELLDVNIHKSNSQWNNLDNEYEIHLTEESSVILSSRPATSFKSTVFEYTPLKNILSMSNHKLPINVIGCISKVPSTVVIGNNKVIREVEIVDQDEISFDVVYWEKRAINFIAKEGDFLTLHNVKINCFRSKINLQVGASSTDIINDNSDEINTLRILMRGTSDGTESN